MITHFNPTPINAYLACLMTLIICSIHNDMPIIKKMAPKLITVKPLIGPKTLGTKKAIRDKTKIHIGKNLDINAASAGSIFKHKTPNSVGEPMLCKYN